MKSGLLAILALLVLAVPVRAITAEELEGLGVETRVTYTMRIRRAEGEFSPTMTMVMRFKVDDGRLVGEVIRTTTTPRGPRSRTDQMRARIGKPGEPATGGHGLWLFEDNKLVLLRAFATGGFKSEIEFSGAGPDLKCSVRAPFVREEGAGPIRAEQSIVGGPVTILSAKQISESCKVTR